MGRENNKMIDVSIIIVNYNGSLMLKECLETLYNFSTGFDCEIIIVDNHSTEENIDEVVKGFSNIILIKNETNLGFSKANNIGLKIAKGKFVLLLNNDVYFTENSIKKVLEFADRQPEKSFVGCKLLNPDGSWQASSSSFPNIINIVASNLFLYLLFSNSRLLNKYYLQNLDVNKPVKVDYVLGAFLFSRREILLSLNGFDEKFFFYGEDIDLCFRLKAFGGSTIFFPDTSVVHIGGASVKNNQWFKFRNKSIAELQFYQKHFFGLKFLVAVIFTYLGHFIRIPISLVIGLFKFDRDLVERSYFHLKLLFVYPKNIFRD